MTATTTAFTYVQLAAQVYLYPPMIGQLNSAGRAIVSTTEDGRVITFRGSDDIASWLHDLEAVTQPVPGLGDVHAGFWSAWLEIAVPCLDVQPQVLAGHSLGAALAIIAAANLCLKGKPPKAVYAFEPPRVSTDSAIHQLLLDNGVELYLFRNGRDIVTQIPMALPDWPWYPLPLIGIGEQGEFFDNVEDHAILEVVQAVQVWVASK